VNDVVVVRLPQDWFALFPHDADKLVQSLEEYADAVMVEADLDGIPEPVGVAMEAAARLRGAVSSSGWRA
jgi:hypothetical protein